jgi:hypothetical protein
MSSRIKFDANLLSHFRKFGFVIIPNFYDAKKEIEHKLLITVAPDGYLKRIR